MTAKQVDQGQLSLFPEELLAPPEISSKGKKRVGAHGNADDEEESLSPVQELAYAKRNFERAFRSLAGRNWRVIWNDNRRAMISFKRDRPTSSLRVHVMFALAPHDLIVGIADFACGNTSRWPVELRQFINDHYTMVDDGPKHARPARLKFIGKVYDLRQMFDDLNERYFNAELACNIGWAKPPKQAKRSLKLGSWSEQTDTIRVHPSLDRGRVPRYVVESILFHEMAHAFVGVQKDENGRRIIHGDEFNELIARFPDSVKADQWIERHQNYLFSWRKN